MNMKKILAVPLVCAGLSMPAVTLGSPIEPGFDLFKTPGNGKTFVDLGPLGKIRLKGYPELIASEGLGNTDTIVERKQGIDPFEHPLIGAPSVGTVDIELVALSLKSIKPISIDVSKLPSVATHYVGGYVGDADLYVTVNALRDRPNVESVNSVLLPNLPQPDELDPSNGSMKIDHKGNPDGFSSQGDFISKLEVFADLIFVVAGKDISDEANWLASMPAPDTVNLSGEGHWTHERPANDMHNEDYPAGKFYVTKIKHVGPHQPKPADGCGPGKHWVDKCPAGTDKTSSTAVVGITFNSDGSPVGEMCEGGVTVGKLELSGPTVIERGDGTKSALTEPPAIPPAPPLDDHHIDTEMVSMVLTGANTLGPITIHAGVNQGLSQPSLGKIIELADDPLRAYSYFWVYHEIYTPWGILHNNDPVLMAAIIDRVPPLWIPYEYPLEDPIFLYNADETAIIACLLPSIIHVLPVTLDYFTATAGNGAVALEWATGTEKDNAGFKVWRGQPLGGQCSNDPNNYTNVQAITPLVASQGTEVSGATYTMTDSNVVSGNTYCYALEDRDFGGKSTFHLDDIVSAMP